jgi:glycogen debranching enzyme
MNFHLSRVYPGLCILGYFQAAPCGTEIQSALFDYRQSRNARAARPVSSHPRTVLGLLIWMTALLFSPLASAQLSFETNSVAPERFIAVHGRKAVIMGYAASGLELWAYPLQLLSGYEPAFRSTGNTTEINASALLRRVTYEPEAITRTYIGPDFIVREKLFVPLNDAAILITYSVESRHSIDVIIHFTPVLDLMWPASVGGQNTHWDSTASAYILAEATHTYSALIGSPGVVSHDQVLNSAQPGTLSNRLAFVVRAGGDVNHSATVVVARNDGKTSPAVVMKTLLTAKTTLETEARAHYAQLLASTLRIETPDNAVNQQLAWAQIALDQAWVCNDVLGCGLVAGYGPSRDTRRPQYAWFFAGDALIAIDALLSSGDYERAQQALAFIDKYQDPRTGMIWHELSQSADPANWATRYPYMFVHVDITFHYLITVEHYVSVSGDTLFLQQNWRGIEAAYRYCASLLNADDGLPRIPSSKEGGNEQDRMTDDLGLSTSWVQASSAFATLARLSGHAQLAEQAVRLSEKANSSVARRYWDDQRNAWIDGYDQSGRPVFRRSDDGVDLVANHILDQRRSQFILDQLASSDFETDWGTRGVAAGSSHFDPASYASGSVSAVGTAGVSSAFWSEHRPLTAFSIWSGLLPWGTLDAMGHLHEVLAGNFYHQQTESVPEQTWSSAAFLSSAVHGLLGLEREARANRLAFSPHLPSAWDRLSIKNIMVPGGYVAMTLTRLPNGLELQTENSGGPIELLFSPEIPLGAHLSGAELSGKPVDAQTQANAQDQHATLRFTLTPGKSHCLVRYEGGVTLSLESSAPLLGDSSKGIKVISATYKPGSLVVNADVSQDGPAATIHLRTNEKPLQAHGAELRSVSTGRYDLVVDASATNALKADSAAKPASGNYRHVQIIVDFADRVGKSKPAKQAAEKLNAEGTGR